MSATTFDVLASVTAEALSWPVSVPATIAVSASTAPVTEPPSAIVIFFATMSPCTVPATTSSPPPTTSPVILRSTLRMDGAASRPPNPDDDLSALVPLDLNNALPHFQEFLGIERLAVHHHLVMQVRPRAPARTAELADFLMRADLLPARDGDAVQVSVMRDDAVAVVDLHELAIGIARARESHDAGRGAVDRRTECRDQIDAGMEALVMIDGIDARAERALDLVLAERCSQRQGLQELAQCLVAGGPVLGRGLARGSQGDIGTAFALRGAAQAPDEILHIEAGRRDHALEIADHAVDLGPGLRGQRGDGLRRLDIGLGRIGLGEARLDALQLLLERVALGGQALALGHDPLALGADLLQLRLRAGEGRLEFGRPLVGRLHVLLELLDARVERSALRFRLAELRLVLRQALRELRRVVGFGVGIVLGREKLRQQVVALRDQLGARVHDALQRLLGVGERALEGTVLRADDVEAVLGAVDLRRRGRKLRPQIAELAAQFPIREFSARDLRLSGRDHMTEVHVAGHEKADCRDNQEYARSRRDLRTACQRDVRNPALGSDQDLSLGE